jgi:hypothetical protein
MAGNGIGNQFLLVSLRLARDRMPGGPVDLQQEFHLRLVKEFLAESLD